MLNWHCLAKGNQVGDELSDAGVCLLVHQYATEPLFPTPEYIATFSTVLQSVWRGGVRVPVTKFNDATAQRWPSGSDGSLLLFFIYVVIFLFIFVWTHVIVVDYSLSLAANLTFFYTSHFPGARNQVTTHC